MVQPFSRHVATISASVRRIAILYQHGADLMHTLLRTSMPAQNRGETMR